MTDKNFAIHSFYILMIAYSQLHEHEERCMMVCNASISRKCYFELADGYEDSANEEYQVAIKLFLSRYR